MFELPAISTAQTTSALCEFIREMTSKTKAESLILGLSGGIDSALVAYLIAESKVGIPLRLFWLPYRTSDPVSLRDAKLVADALGLSIEERSISGVVDSAIQTWSVEDRLRIGNLAARARMMALFDASSQYRGVVVGTSNLSERCLGYGTLHGDLACAFNPLGNLFKTEVRQLAKALRVPNSVIAKPPTADLWAAQTDEGELGFTYANADRVLFLHVRSGLSRAKIIERGMDESLVHKVLDRMEKNAFKSNPIPLGPLPR